MLGTQLLQKTQLHQLSVQDCEDFVDRMSKDVFEAV